MFEPAQARCFRIHERPSRWQPADRVFAAFRVRQQIRKTDCSGQTLHLRVRDGCVALDGSSVLASFTLSAPRYSMASSSVSQRDGREAFPLGVGDPCHVLRSGNPESHSDCATWVLLLTPSNSWATRLKLNGQRHAPEARSPNTAVRHGDHSAGQPIFVVRFYQHPGLRRRSRDPIGVEITGIPVARASTRTIRTFERSVGPAFARPFARGSPGANRPRTPLRATRIPLPRIAIRVGASTTTTSQWQDTEQPWRRLHECIHWLPITQVGDADEGEGCSLGTGERVEPIDGVWHDRLGHRRNQTAANNRLLTARTASASR